MFKTLYQKCLDLASHKSSNFFLGLVSFIESSFFPIPPDVMIIPMVIAKKKSYLKIFLVAFVWSGVTTTIPLIVGQYQQDYSLVLLFVQRMLFILVLILPFEIRDMKLDFKKIKKHYYETRNIHYSRR